MILGMGLDLCSIERLRRALRVQGFRERVFSEEEIVYVADRRNPEASLAACFAAKEAFAKATGWGLASVGLRGVWVVRTPRGPRLEWNSENRRRLETWGAARCHLSLTHERDYAAAVVLLEGNDHASRL